MKKKGRKKKVVRRDPIQRASKLLTRGVVLIVKSIALAMKIQAKAAKK